MARGYQGTGKGDIGFNMHQKTLRNNRDEINSRTIKVETLTEQFERVKKEKETRLKKERDESLKPKEEKVKFIPTSEGFYKENKK